MTRFCEKNLHQAERNLINVTLFQKMHYMSDIQSSWGGAINDKLVVHTVYTSNIL